MIPGVPSRSTNEPYCESNGTTKTDTVRNADAAKNRNRNLLGSTDIRCINDISNWVMKSCRTGASQKIRVDPCGSCYHRLIDENARNTINATGIIRLNLAITSTAFPLHMRLDDIIAINAANSIR